MYMYKSRGNPMGIWQQCYTVCYCRKIKPRWLHYYYTLKKTHNRYMVHAATARIKHSYGVAGWLVVYLKRA